MPADEQLWRTIGRGRATTWTIKFNMDHAARGRATLRMSLATPTGAAASPSPSTACAAGTIYPVPTNAPRYNTNKSVWQELKAGLRAADLMKSGENEMQLGRARPAKSLPASFTTICGWNWDENKAHDNSSGGVKVAEYVGWTSESVREEWDGLRGPIPQVNSLQALNAPPPRVLGAGA